MPPPVHRTHRTRRARAARLASGLALFGAPALLAPQQDETPATTPLWRLAEKAAEETGAAEDFRAVAAHFAGTWRFKGGPAHRLERVMAALERPWEVPALGAELRDALAGTLGGKRGARCGEAAVAAAGWLGVDPLPADDPELAALELAWARACDPEVEGAELLAALSELMGRAHLMLSSSLRPLDEPGRKALHEGHLPFCEAWYRTHFPGAQPDEGQAAALSAVASLLVALPVERSRQATAGAVLARMAEPAFLDSLPKRLARTPETKVEREGFTGDIVASAGEAPSELVVLAGTGRSVLAGRAALVIDLGGDDRWQRAAVADGADALAAVAIDLRGDDTYETRTPGPAYACGGAAVLVDRAGKDVYRSGRLGQAASFLGFALQADLAGDDAYSVEDYGQAYALGGIALLFDAAGDDVYEAWACAQGTSNGPGFAALVDGGGDDRYLSDGHWPDLYGDSGPNVFHGASQGYSAGMRPEVPGGIAALLDLGQGSDDYQSGNFSQGGAYYYGFALLYDEAGDDASRGTRYSQGFGVHQAAALHWDAAGDDRHECRSAANLGAAWDEGVGFFLDDAGDDVYQGGGISCAGAAQTGIAIFVDASGDDSYVTAAEADSQGGSGASDYHDQPSLAFLLDLGGGKDSYSRPGRADGVLQGSAGCGLFWDAKEKTVERLLRR